MNPYDTPTSPQEPLRPRRPLTPMQWFGIIIGVLMILRLLGITRH